MQIQVYSDKTIEAGERQQAYFSAEIETALQRFDSKITRVEVHFGDENGEKFDPKDKRCIIEARLAGMQPVAVTHFADTVDNAFRGAADKLKNVLHTAFDKMRNC